MMIKSIKDIYFSVFLLFFRFCNKAWSHEMNVVKAVTGVTMVHGWLLVGLIAWVYYLTGRNLLTIPKLAFYLIFVFIGLINYYALVIRGSGIAFQHEFHTFGTRRKAFLTAIAIALVAFSAVFALLSASYVHSHISSKEHIPAS